MSFSPKNAKLSPVVIFSHTLVYTLNTSSAWTMGKYTLSTTLMKCVCVCALMYQLHLKLCAREKKTGDVQLKCTFHSQAVCYFSPPARLANTHASLTTLSYLFVSFS